LADVGVDGVAKPADRGVERDSAVDEGDGPVAIEVEREFGVGGEAEHVADGAGQAVDIEGDAQRRTRPPGDRVAGSVTATDEDRRLAGSTREAQVS